MAGLFRLTGATLQPGKEGLVWWGQPVPQLLDLGDIHPAPFRQRLLGQPR